jgi:hypothetical protein
MSFSGGIGMMASTSELVEAIYQIIARSPTPIPVTLMNHGVEAAAEIIGAVVEQCYAQRAPFDYPDRV